MTTYTLGSYDDIALLNETVPPADAASLGNCEYVLSNRVNMRGGVIVGGTDLVECLKVPAGSWVKQVWVDVITADTDVTDVDFGTQADPDGFLDGISFATTGIKLQPIGARALYKGGTASTGAGEKITTADTIDADINTSHTTAPTSGAIIDVYALIFKPRGFRSDSAAF